MPKWLKVAPPKDSKYGHERDGYTDAGIERLLKKGGFKVQKHDCTYKAIARIILEVFYATKLRLFAGPLTYPLAYFDRFLRNKGACHVILAQKGPP
jgi:hypothetical protein